MIDYESLSKIVEDILKIFGIEPKGNILAYLTLGISVILIFIILAIRFIKINRWRKKQRDEILKGYERYTTLWQRWLYIKTWFQINPPHDLDEPYDSQSRYLRTNSIDFFIKRVFKQGNQNPPYYCILGGSGMGKSTFVVNLVRKYIDKYKGKTLPYPIKLLYCGETVDGNDSLLNRIKAIDNKENTILILDALDENNEAIDNYSDFFTQLWENVTRFRIVVITCRTQFFEKLEDEPNLLPSRDPATKKQIQFEKYYISPFQDEEIDRYIDKKYLLRFSAKRKAKAIVNNCKQLMARPLLLSYLDDLLDAQIGNGKESIVQIYEILINKWLEREANFYATMDKEREKYIKNLRTFSNELALCMAQPSYEKKQIDVIIARYGANTLVKERNLKVRSLLNRNSKNDYKFAHKSFMEFLVAMQLSKPNNNILLESIDCVSNDMIPVFLSYMLSNKLKQQRNNEINIFLSEKYSFSFGSRGYDPYLYFIYKYKLNGSSYRIIHNEMNFHINCEISANIERFLSAFIDFFCGEEFQSERKTDINIYIDCHYNFYSLANCINNILNGTSMNDKLKYKFGLTDDGLNITISTKKSTTLLPGLFFINYNFREYNLVDFLVSLNELGKMLKINILINNMETDRKDDIRIINSLRQYKLSIWIQEEDVVCSLEEYEEYKKYYKKGMPLRRLKKKLTERKDNK